MFPLHDSNGELIGTMCGFYYTEKNDNLQVARTKLQPAIDWMIKHNNAPTSLDELAKLTQLSVTHFRRLFVKTFNESPAKYAIRLRLNQARDALENTNQTIAAIAFDAGFYDQSHFIKAFHRIYKMNPTNYRKRHGKFLSDHI